MQDRRKEPPAIIVMGVSGSGKSSVGQALATRLGLAYIEGDSLHPASNVEKMSKGIPLTDEDRMPWLDLIGERLHAKLAGGEGVVVTCSSLKRSYRDRLRSAAPHLYFVYLEGSKALLTKRMGERKGHFMPTSLLESQLQTLEVPTGERGVVTVDIDNTVHGIVDAAVDGLAALR
jgi:gluconokinase